MRTVSLPLPIAARRPPPRCMARRGVRQRPSSVVRTADFCFGRQHNSCARLRKFDRDNRRETPEMIFLALQESNYEQARAHASHPSTDCTTPVDSDADSLLPCGNRRFISANRNRPQSIVQVCEFHALKERLLWSQQVGV